MDIRRISRWQTALTLFLAAVGFLVVTQLRSQQPLRQASELPTWRLQELAVLVRQQEAARLVLEAEVEALQRQIRDYEVALTEGRSLSEAIGRDLAHYRMVLGLIPVRGPGVRVTMDEGSPMLGVLPPVVRADDLAGLANELWSAGAEAMTINGMRVLATTGVRQHQDAVTVGGRPVAPPYRIEAIGDGAAMQAALAIRGGFVDGLRAVGLVVEVQPVAALRLPGRPAIEPFRHARRKTAE